MITCPNCGAGNKPEASACRMCAASLEGIGEGPGARVQTPGGGSPASAPPQSHRREEATAPVEQEGIVCSECNTLNEVGWSFCQQCGKRLVQPQPAPPQTHDQVAAGLRTNPEQQAVEDPMAPQSFKTVVAKPPQIEHGMRTVAERMPPDEPLKTVFDRQGAPDQDLKPARERPPTDPGSRPVAPPPPPPQWQPPPVDQESRTLREEIAPVEPEPQYEPPPPAPPRIVEEPVSKQPPPTNPRPFVVPPTVVAQIPPQPKPAAPPPPPPPPAPPVQQPAAPPRVSAPEHATRIAQSISGVLCNQCGQATGVGSAFCASCGAPVTYGKTMVISSQKAPPPVVKGFLHLVMEGGQTGEVYELEDETVIGRSNGEITFPHDGFMSGRHARIERRDDSFILTDEGSRNGTFVKIKGEVELKPGDTILVGKQLFRFDV